MSQKILRFSSGGFVIHGIKPPQPSKAESISAWYDRGGNLQDAEFLYSTQINGKPVRSGKTIESLNIIGRINKAYFQRELA